MINSNKSIKINALLNGLRTILNLLFPLITFPYISRVLTVDEIGKYNFSESIVTYFLLIAALGINQYAIREGSKYKNDRKKMSEFASKVFTVNILSTLISYILLFVAMAISKKLDTYTNCILLLSTQIFFTTIGTEWIYFIFEEFAYITIRSIVFKVISIILLFILIRKPGDYLKYTFVIVFANVGSNILNFFNTRKLVDICLTNSFEWKEIVKPIMIIFASNVAMQIYVSSDITMLGYLKNDYNVGVYSVSTRIYSIIKSVLTAVLTVAIPRFSYYAGNGLKNDYSKLLKKVINTLFVMGIPVVAGLIVLSDNVVNIIAGEKYYEAHSSLCILCVAIIFAIFNGLLNQSVLLAYGREKIFLYCTVISALLNIVLNIFMIPLFAENGAAFTTVISELVLFVLLFVKSRDLIMESFLNKFTLNNIISIMSGSIGIVVFCVFIKKLVFGLIVQTIISVIGASMIYGLILLLFRNEMIINFVSNMFGKIKNR